MEQNIICICERLSKTAYNEAVRFDDLMHFEKELTNSDMPTSVKFNRYDNEISTVGGQSDIRGMDKNITTNIDKLDFYIFKDNIEMVNYPSTLLIHFVLNRNDFNVSNVKQIDITTPMKKISVSSASGGQGIGRLNDDVVFTQLRSNLFVGDIIHFFYSLSKKTVFILAERGDAYKEKILPQLKSIFENLDSGIMHTNNIVFETKKTMDNKHNVIYYGVPGVGKSYEIKKKCENEIFEQEKTVFHPEYTNADFVGQLLPVRNKNEVNALNDVNNKKSGISYEFVPGPFTRILAVALKNKHDPDKKYMLVIDEINRGNAAAIFGEIFQLLDRDESGESEFSISNKDIYDYLIEKEGVDKLLLPDEKIYLPSNLYIWATMNTSDQNVYTLDTAFQRRWQMEMLTIDFNKDNETKAQGEIPILNSKNKLTWKEFVTSVNDEISKRNEGMISVEDKRIGPWFAKKNEIEDKNLFTQKVIKYLWDDAFKMSRTDVFKDIKTLDDIVDKINNGSTIEDIFDEKIFEKVINDRKKSLQNGQETNDENEIEDTNE